MSDFKNYDYAVDYAVESRNVNGSEQLSLFRDCQPFEKPELRLSGSKYFFGFEVTWSEKRRCFLADETKTSVQLKPNAVGFFGYNITDVDPATESAINVRPYYAYFTYGQTLAQIVFGIQSKTRHIKIADDLPAVAPNHIKAIRRTGVSITLRWEPLNETLSNGKVIGYEVLLHCDNDARCTEESISTEVNTVTVDCLCPDRNYTFTVSGKTSVGYGPKSSKISIVTCKINTLSNGNRQV